MYSDSQVQQAVVTVESDVEMIRWDTLETGDSSKLLQTLTSHISEKELDTILTSIESLDKETLEVVLENLD